MFFSAWMATLGMVLAMVLVLALAVRILPVFVAKQQLDTYAVELVREAEISGRVGTETSRRAAALTDSTGKHQQDQHDGEDHWGALAGVAAKETVLAHFQYTSDFPVASDRSVMGNEPKPPNRPMSMSNVSVTVTSSLS